MIVYQFKTLKVDHFVPGNRESTRGGKLRNYVQTCIYSAFWKLSKYAQKRLEKKRKNNVKAKACSSMILNAFCAHNI